MALLGLVLSLVLYLDLASANLPASISIEKLAGPPESGQYEDGVIANDIAWEQVPPVNADRSGQESGRSKKLWFRIRFPNPGIQDASVVANFNVGLLTPDIVWYMHRGDQSSNPGSGESTPTATMLRLQETPLGKYVTLPKATETRIELLALVSSPGVGQPKMTLMKRDNLELAAENFVTRTIVFAAVFLILTCFSAAVATSSKDWSFLIFAGWLLASLRLVAVNSGWGLAWLNAHFSTEAVSVLLPLSFAAYGLFTIALFRGLLGEQLAKRKSRHAFAVLQATYVLLGLGSLLIPSQAIYPLMWGVSGVAILGIVVESLRIAVSKRDPVAGMFFLSWLLTLSGMAAEIAYNAAVLSMTFAAFNAETGALGGAMMCALALAQRLKTEIVGRQMASKRAIKASQELKRNYESMPIGLFACRANGDLTLFNPAFHSIYRAISGSAARPYGSNLQTIIGNAPFERLVTQSRVPDTPLIATIKTPGHNGDRWLHVNLKRNDHLFEGTLEDVTVRVQAENALARLVDHDVLTNALNLRGLNEAVSNALRLTASGSPCSLIEIDVDRFKTLNDLYGHIVGDQILASVCELLQKSISEDESLARIGDSFRIVVTNKEPYKVLELATSIQASVSGSPIEVSRRLLSLTTSIGIVSLDPAMAVRDAMAASSQACSDAKARGRNRVIQLGKQDMALHGYLEELKVQENLQDRIDSQRFFLEFQPIVSFKSAFESLNYEVLVRMRGEDGSVIPPGRFIPAAERNGQMSLIDRWVVQATLRWLDQHRDHVRNLGYATINLSGSSLNDARFVDNLFAMIAEYPSVMNKLCFEITETVALADQNATRRFSERVHSMGSRVALDDFGAGYTSFTYLREIDADIIKIDGSFVKDINQNPANYAITRMIVELSHQLGKRCVAEWAEKPDVIATLMQLGVDYGQGFALARPLPPSSLVHVDNCGELIIDPEVRAMLQGTLSTEQGASGRSSGIIQPALF